MTRPKRLPLWEHVSLQSKSMTDAKLPDTFEAPDYGMNQRREMNIEVLWGGVKRSSSGNGWNLDLFKHSAQATSVHSRNGAMTRVALTQFC